MKCGEKYEDMTHNIHQTYRRGHGFESCSGLGSHIGKVCRQAKSPIRSEVIPVSYAATLDGMLVHHKATPSTN